MSNHELPVIALDVDGVLLDYLGGFVPWLRTQGYKPLMEAHEINDWDFGNVLPDITVPQLVDLIGQFSVSPGFGELVPLKGALEAIKTLREEFPNHEIIAITSAGSEAITEQMRRANLEKHAFGISSVTVLPLGASKRDNLLALPPGSIFVDDLIKNIRVADEVGMHAILFRHPYNAKDSHHLCADGWTEAVALIRDLLNRPASIPSAA